MFSSRYLAEMPVANEKRRYFVHSQKCWNYELPMYYIARVYEVEVFIIVMGCVHCVWFQTKCEILKNIEILQNTANLNRSHCILKKSISHMLLRLLLLLPYISVVNSNQNEIERLVVGLLCFLLIFYAMLNSKRSLYKFATVVQFKASSLAFHHISPVVQILFDCWVFPYHSEFIVYATCQINWFYVGGEILVSFFSEGVKSYHFLCRKNVCLLCWQSNEIFTMHNGYNDPCNM